MKETSYGVGSAATIATDCAAAIQLPAAIADPWAAANKPPATGPTVERPINPNTAGDRKLHLQLQSV